LRYGYQIKPKSHQHKEGLIGLMIITIGTLRIRDNPCYYSKAASGGVERRLDVEKSIKKGQGTALIAFITLKFNRPSH
jgi:hypothetical protein